MKECALLLVETTISPLLIISVINAWLIVKIALEKVHAQPAIQDLYSILRLVVFVILKLISCITEFVWLNALVVIIQILTEEFAKNALLDVKRV